jgi:hypothetical protein
MANERKTAGVNIGGASIIMVFSVLCLTIFSVLTLVSANAESSLANKSVKVVTDFYKADELATEKLASVYQIVDEQSSLQNAKVNIEKISKDILVDEKNNILYISYFETIDDSQQLAVALRVDGKKVDIVNWKVENTGEWEPDNSLDLWQG